MIQQLMRPLMLMCSGQIDFDRRSKEKRRSKARGIRHEYFHGLHIRTTIAVIAIEV